MRTKGLETGARVGEPGACGGRRCEVLWLERRRGQCGHGADRRKRHDVDTVPPRQARIAEWQRSEESLLRLLKREVSFIVQENLNGTYYLRNTKVEI